MSLFTLSVGTLEISDLLQDIVWGICTRGYGKEKKAMSDHGPSKASMMSTKDSCAHENKSCCSLRTLANPLEDFFNMPGRHVGNSIPYSRILDDSTGAKCHISRLASLEACVPLIIRRIEN